MVSRTKRAAARTEEARNGRSPDQDRGCRAAGRPRGLCRPTLRRPPAVLGLGAARGRAARQPVRSRALDDRAVRTRLAVRGAGGRARGRARNLAVRFASGRVSRATIVGTAPNYDLAVLRVNDTKSLPPPIAIGTSEDLKVGQSVFAIGNPFGLDQSLTTGIISALKRRLPTSAGREISDVIQTDAGINPGNSGGPLLDSAGRVIGVNTAILSPSGTSAGIGFAIPVDVVNRVVPEIIRRGYVPTPGIGIIAASEAEATRAGVEGVVIVRTVPGSSAEQAGLRGIDQHTRTLGDVIVGVNGKPVRRLPDLIQEIERVGVGNKVTLTVKRDGRERSVEVEAKDIGRKA